MPGIEIISTETFTYPSTMDLEGMRWIFITLGLVAVPILWSIIKKDKGWMINAFAIGSAFFIMVAACGVYGTFTETEAVTENHYLVQVDDSVSMSQFKEEYEILAEVNDYYIVKDKVDE